MTDVKRLLGQATPLPWRADEHYDSLDNGYGIYGGGEPDSIDEGEVAWSADLFGRDASRANAALIVHAVNSLPAYEEAVDALERFVTFHSGHVLPNELAVTMRFARAALSRLRGEK